MDIVVALKIARLDRKLAQYDNSFGEYDRDKRYRILSQLAEDYECKYEEGFHSLVTRSEGYIAGYNAAEEN